MSIAVDWPEGRKFAFTVFDDTDLATLENVMPVYRLLEDLGFRTTKSVWPVRGKERPAIGGATCEDRQYLAWVKGLQRAGFEIGLHNVTYHSSLREETVRGISRFEDLFGHPPNSLANHAENREGIYWGEDRLSGADRLLYRILTRGRRAGAFTGHTEGDPHFWGDICREKVRHVRNFVFPDVNTLAACPYMPYHDRQRPYVNAYFASSSGPDMASFNRLISEKNQDRLEEEGGACIVYTHFAKGFSDGKAPDRRFRGLMSRLRKKNGWFVPVTELLDYLLDRRGLHEISEEERRRLQRKWLLSRLRTRGA